jgi:hypothetical protein
MKTLESPFEGIQRSNFVNCRVKISVGGLPRIGQNIYTSRGAANFVLQEMPGIYIYSFQMSFSHPFPNEPYVALALCKKK